MSVCKVYNAEGDLVGEFDATLQIDESPGESWKPVWIGADFEVGFDRKQARKVRDWMQRLMTPARILDLRHQLKRKGKPGWKHMRVRSRP